MATGDADIVVQPPSAVQDKAGFELKDTYGKAFKRSDFKGKIVVLKWINRNCPISRGCHEKTVMQKTYKKYAAKGVIWLAIDTTVGTDPESNRVYVAAALEDVLAGRKVAKPKTKPYGCTVKYPPPPAKIK